MRPVLYDQNEKDFLSNGIGVLNDCISCVVTEERNGKYELEMEYPVTGIHFGEIANLAIIKAEPAPKSEAQPFRIYKITKPINGIVTVCAEHISYQLSYIPVSPFTGSGVKNAFVALKNAAAEECPFEFYSDVQRVGTIEITEPASVRNCLGGMEGSFLDVFGGELLFDKYKVSLLEERGVDRGVVLRYGKNIIDIEQENNIQNTITGIYPYWTDGGQTVTLPEKTVSVENADNFPFRRTIPYDFSSDFEEKPTEEQLRNRARSYIKANEIGIPKVSIKVSFVPLAQTEEYKGLRLLEDVYLCDTVSVEFEKLGISAKAKVVKTVYDVLKKRYESVEIGEMRTNLSNTVLEQEKRISEEISKRKAATKKLADKLASASGLYMTNATQPDGSVIYYMHNKTNLSDSTIVWKMTAEAFGISTDGGRTYPYGLDVSGDAILKRIYADDLVSIAAKIGGWNINKNRMQQVQNVIIDGIEYVYHVALQSVNDYEETSNYIYVRRHVYKENDDTDYSEASNWEYVSYINKYGNASFEQVRARKSLQHGSVTVRPESPGVPVSVRVSFSESMCRTPTVVLTPKTAVPGVEVTGVGVTDEDTNGFTLYFTRSNTVETTIFWAAFAD